MSENKFLTVSDVPNEFEGKAIIPLNGNEYWFIRGKIIHRDDGPALTFSNGTKYWFNNGKYHRLDGPAGVYATGIKEFWIDDQSYSEEQYWKHPLVVKHMMNQILNG